jgi:hypothetical protein
LTKFNHNQNGNGKKPIKMDKFKINLFKNDTLVKLDNGGKKPARKGEGKGVSHFFNKKNNDFL